MKKDSMDALRPRVSIEMTSNVMCGEGCCRSRAWTRSDRLAWTQLLHSVPPNALVHNLNGSFFHRSASRESHNPSSPSFLGLRLPMPRSREHDDGSIDETVRVSLRNSASAPSIHIKHHTGSCSSFRMHLGRGKSRVDPVGQDAALSHLCWCSSPEGER
jgi:hypothetical protein